MKNLLVFIFISCSLFSSVLQDGFNLYKNQNYIEAYEKFYTIHTRNKSNITISVYMAKALFHLGEYQKVEKILLPIYKKAHNEEASLYLAYVYFYEKNYTKSKEILSEIKVKNHKADIEKLLKKIEEKTKLHFFHFYFSLGLSHDNNIDNNTFARYTRYLDDTISTNDTQKNSDIFIDKTLFVSHIYKLPNILNAVWKDNMFLYDRSGIKYSNENISFASIHSGPVINTEIFTIKPQIFINDMFYESEHYMYSYGLSFEMDRNIKSGLYLDAKISYKKNKYIQAEDKTQNSNSFGFLAHLRQNLTATDTLKYLFLFENTDKTENGRYDISKNKYAYNIRYIKKLPRHFSLELNARYIDYKYRDFEPNLGRRKDIRTIYGVKLSKKLQNSYTVSIDYHHIYNNSNMDLYSYKKDTFELMLSKYF